MYSRKEVGVFAWILLLFLLSIPVVNIVVGILLLLSSKTNNTIKNFFKAFIILWFLAFFGLFTGTFDNMLGLFH